MDSEARCAACAAIENLVEMFHGPVVVGAYELPPHSHGCPAATAVGHIGGVPVLTYVDRAPAAPVFTDEEHLAAIEETEEEALAAAAESVRLAMEGK